MSSLLIDTNAYTALLQGKAEALALFRDAEVIYFPFVVVAELFSGFRLGSREDQNRKSFLQLLETENIIVLYPNDDTLEKYASVFVALRRMGKPIPTNDIWIAAMAIQHDLPLFTLDKHFENIDSLTIFPQETGPKSSI